MIEALADLHVLLGARLQDDRANRGGIALGVGVGDGTLLNGRVALVGGDSEHERLLDIGGELTHPRLELVDRHRHGATELTRVRAGVVLAQRQLLELAHRSALVADLRCERALVLALVPAALEVHHANQGDRRLHSLRGRGGNAERGSGGRVEAAAVVLTYVCNIT